MCDMDAAIGFFRSSTRQHDYMRLDLSNAKGVQERSSTLLATPLHLLSITFTTLGCLAVDFWLTADGVLLDPLQSASTPTELLTLKSTWQSQRSRPLNPLLALLRRCTARHFLKAYGAQTAEQSPKLPCG